MKGGNGGLLRLLEQNIGGNVNVTVTVHGDSSGSASVALNVSTSGTGTSLTETITYNNFSEDGQNRYNGTWTITLNTSQSSVTGGLSGAITLVESGNISISGAIDDTITATNFTLGINYSSSNTAGSAVSITATGTLATSTASYTYSGDTFNFAANASLTAATH
jgi:hypothetical protein